MRIRDLLSVQSIELGGKPGNKTEVLNHMVDLMAKGGKYAKLETLQILKLTARVYLPEKRKELPVSEWE